MAKLEAGELGRCAEGIRRFLNGVELGGGSIRFTNQIAGESRRRWGQRRRSAVLSVTSCARLPGAPPHGGIAFRLDRIVMMTAAKKVSAKSGFPKTPRHRDLRSQFDARQLRELGIKLADEKKV
jgi:aspartyl-tRNA synthetase